MKRTLHALTAILVFGSFLVGHIGISVRLHECSVKKFQEVLFYPEVGFQTTECCCEGENESCSGVCISHPVVFSSNCCRNTHQYLVAGFTAMPVIQFKIIPEDFGMQLISMRLQSENLLEPVSRNLATVTIGKAPPVLPVKRFLGFHHFRIPSPEEPLS